MIGINDSGRELEIDGTTVTLPEPINEALRINGVGIVRTDTLGKSNQPRNVYAIDTDGHQLWQIEAGDTYQGEKHPYVGIRVDDGELWAANWNGYDYKVDPKTGDILTSELSR